MKATPPTRWIQPVHCMACGNLLGFAPYAREAYLCVACNKQLPLDEEDKPFYSEENLEVEEGSDAE